MTSLTPRGGFAIDLTIVMSFCLSVFRAVIAAFIAGIATSSCDSQSSYGNADYMEYIVHGSNNQIVVLGQKKKDNSFWSHQNSKLTLWRWFFF